MYILIGTTVVRIIGTYDTPEVAAAVVRGLNAEDAPSVTYRSSCGCRNQNTHAYASDCIWPTDRELFRVDV